MNSDNTKSSVTAGILGVFLGAFGGHDWYLGNTKKAITHVCLCVGGVILLMLGLILTDLAKDIPALKVLFVCLIVAAYVIIVGNGVWGFIEGVIIIAQGDAGLAAKGYKVATAATQTMAPTVPVAPAAGEDAKVESGAQAEPGKVEPVAPAGIITANPAEASSLPGSAPLANAVTSAAEADKKEEQPVVQGAPFAPVDTPVAASVDSNAGAAGNVNAVNAGADNGSATNMANSNTGAAGANAGMPAVDPAKDPVVATVTPDPIINEAKADAAPAGQTGVQEVSSQPVAANNSGVGATANVATAPVATEVPANDAVRNNAGQMVNGAAESAGSAPVAAEQGNTPAAPAA